MNVILFCTILLTFAQSAEAARTLKIKSLKAGKIKFTQNGVKSVVDFTNDVSGYFQVFDRSSGEVEEFDVTHFDLISSTQRKSTTFVVIAAQSGSNRNIQGECGAADDWTLIWLQMDGKLRPVKKQTVIIQSCLRNDLRNEIAIVGSDSDKEPSVALIGDTLRVKFYSEITSPQNRCQYSTLLYKTTEPEKGFSIRSELKPLLKDGSCE